MNLQFRPNSLWSHLCLWMSWESMFACAKSRFSFDLAEWSQLWSVPSSWEYCPTDLSPCRARYPERSWWTIECFALMKSSVSEKSPHGAWMLFACFAISCSPRISWPTLKCQRCWRSRPDCTWSASICSTRLDVSPKTLHLDCCESSYRAKPTDWERETFSWSLCANRGSHWTVDKFANTRFLAVCQRTLWPRRLCKSHRFLSAHCIDLFKQRHLKYL